MDKTEKPIRLVEISLIQKGEELQTKLVVNHARPLEAQRYYLMLLIEAAKNRLGNLDQAYINEFRESLKQGDPASASQTDQS